MVVYYVIGGLGLAVLLLSLVAGDLLPHVSFDAIDIADGFLSTAAIGGFAAAFGLAGGVATAAGAPGGVAVPVGVVVGAGVGAGAGYLVRSLKNAPELRAPSTGDLVGSEATVVSAIPADGFGEVSVTLHGIRRKLSARADVALGAGAPVRVTHVLSPTSVRVATRGPQDAS